jgi:diguanylate cyclase (GGDEF)-like protein/PAS domain S-box-containing protein
MKDATEIASSPLGSGSEEARLFFDRTLAPQLLINPASGRILDANPAACQFYGYSRADLCARFVTDLNTLSAEQVAEAMATAAAEKRTYFLFQHRLASGEIREVEVRSGPIEIGGKALLLSTIHDVSGRRKVDNNLLMHAQAVGASMDGIAILDGLETFAYVNAAHARIYGYSRADDLLGKSWRALYSAGERERVLADVMPAFWAVGHWRGETTGLRRDGTTFPQEISLVAIEGGGFVCEVRDVTARKRSEKLQSALLRIAEATSSGQDVAGFYETIRRIVGELMDAKNIYIALLDEGTRMISYPYFVDEVEAPPSPHAVGRGLTEYVMRTGIPVLATPADLRRMVAAGEVEVVGAPSLDWLGVPLKRGDEVFGVLAVQSYTESTRYTERERDILTFVSSQLASAIDRNRAALALSESETRFRLLAETAPCAILIYQGEKFSYVNEAATAIAGYTREEFLSMSFWDLVHPEMRELVWERGLARQRGEPVPPSYEIKIVRKDGEERWLSFSAGRIDFGGVPAALGAAFDVTEKKRAEEQVRALAYHDALTGLPNRLLFNDRLALAVAQARRKGERLAVLFLDLDGFKAVNDTLGHNLGDLLLRSTAERIQSALRAVDSVARLGGDEFILLLPGIRRVEEAARVAEKVLESIRAPVALEGHELFVTASMGISVYPEDGEDVETLVKAADTAMYRAKEQGRDRYQLYTPSMNARALERMALENSLRKALARSELLVHYQPVLDLASGRIHGVEALLRWKNAERGEVLPASDFIAMAEVTGLIVPIGPFVLAAACRQARAWQRLGYADLRMAVNLSARQLQQPDLVSQVRKAALEADLDPRMLDLEVTENQTAQNGDALRETLLELKALGVRITIDDFGIAASSLRHLRRLPIDALKIDRSFVSDLLISADDAAIARAVIALAHSLQLQVVAEGVETEEQRALLTDLGCDLVQGHLLSHPVSAEECTSILARYRDRVLL